MTRNGDDDALLDAHFREARTREPRASADLMARILADAEAAQSGLQEPPVRGPEVHIPRVSGGWLAALGGWPVLAGLSASALAGVWIGVAPPAGVAETATAILADDTGYVIDEPFELAFDLGGGASQ